MYTGYEIDRGAQQSTLIERAILHMNHRGQKIPETEEVSESEQKHWKRREREAKESQKKGTSQEETPKKETQKETITEKAVHETNTSKAREGTKSK